MAKITCEVAKDLLPLYVDGVVSEDAKSIVREHLETCEECQQYYKRLTEDDISATTDMKSEDKRVFKNIKRKINHKRIRSVALAVALVVIIGAGVFYAAIIKESYLPYDKAGLYVDDATLKTDQNYYCYYGFDSPDSEIEFVYMTTTFYHSHRSSQQTIEVLHLENHDDPIIRDEDGTVIGEDPVKAIYYVPEEYAKQLSRQDYWVTQVEGSDEKADESYIKANQEKLDELKAASTLIWESK